MRLIERTVVKTSVSFNQTLVTCLLLTLVIGLFWVNIAFGKIAASNNLNYDLNQIIYEHIAVKIPNTVQIFYSDASNENDSYRVILSSHKKFCYLLIYPSVESSIDWNTDDSVKTDVLGETLSQQIGLDYIRSVPITCTASNVTPSQINAYYYFHKSTVFCYAFVPIAESGNVYQVIILLCSENDFEEFVAVFNDILRSFTSIK